MNDKVKDPHDLGYEAGISKVAGEMERLRSTWLDRACLLEALYGKPTPTAEAIRICVKELGDVTDGPAF